MKVNKTKEKKKCMPVKPLANLPRGTCFRFLKGKEKGRWIEDPFTGTFMSMKLPQGTWDYSNAYINLETGAVVDLRGRGFLQRAGILVRPINIVAEEQ